MVLRNEMQRSLSSMTLLSRSSQLAVHRFVVFVHDHMSGCVRRTGCVCVDAGECFCGDRPIELVRVEQLLQRSTCVEAK
jgi:hypothetical protein